MERKNKSLLSLTLNSNDTSNNDLTNGLTNGSTNVLTNGLNNILSNGSNNILADLLPEKKSCPICFEILDDRFDLACCKADICKKCINALNKPECPFCRETIKEIANDPKYRLCSSCPTRDYLTEDLIRQYRNSNIRTVAYDDMLISNRERLNNRRRNLSNVSELNAERRALRIENGSIRPYSRSRTNSEISDQISQGIEVYLDSLRPTNDSDPDSDDMFRLES
jgi:hypothetical protein